MRLRALSLLAAILVALVLVLPGVGSAKTLRLGKSPHTTADGCPACHEAGTKSAPGAVKPIEVACKQCHPDADMHPIGLKPVDVKVPDSFPLEGGALSCATCHENPSCDAKRSTAVPYMRGGNPEPKSDFCYRCHEPSSKARKSPHEPTETARASGACGACHSSIPMAGSSPYESSLRLDPRLICTTCHPDAVHAGAQEHIGAKVKTPLKGAAAKALALGPNGQINCWTCHDVHTFGQTQRTAPTDLAASIQHSRVNPDDVPTVTTGAKKDPMWAMPANDGTLCRACHGDGP
ncbi:hypothetical protein LBMAG42_23510 [Deltaproteobacteria bacterium]|nr:hypothetical protein LBMAG42_23510 [Deltaproteobacteria bacterium]